MSVTPQVTYPGVYIQEVPSGVRTITGVTTSVTAFIGRAKRGPEDEPVTINSFADFERIFGGLWIESTLGYAVRDFYLNGGGQAIIVRLYHDPDSGNSIAKLDANGLKLKAVSPGAWGNYLRARVDSDVSEDLAKSYGLNKTDLFNLTLRDTKIDVTEQFRNVTVMESPRRVNRTLESESQLMRVDSLPDPLVPPSPHLAPAADKDVWEDDNASSKVKDADQALDGKALDDTDFTGMGKEAAKQGLYALEKADLFNLLCIPPYRNDGNVDVTLLDKAAGYVEKRRALLLVDSPSTWTKKPATNDVKTFLESSTTSKNAALFFPRFKQP
nr:hypothetical protein [Candidatus Njordarchaeum guaymaensis]